MSNDKIQQLLIKTMAAAEPHARAIAVLYSSAPRTIEEEMEATIRIAQHGVALAKCFSALMIVGALDANDASVLNGITAKTGVTPETLADVLSEKIGALNAGDPNSN